MKTPRVSIVMPAFNAEKFICETIKSVQSQTCDDWELLVVDDGSSDGTARIVETFLSDSRIQLRRQKNAGVSAARNAALRVARGEWIAFLDADDVWLPQKLELQLKATEANTSANLVFTNYYIWDGERDIELRFKTPEKFPTTDFERRLLQHNLFGMSSVLVKHSAVDAIGEFDPEVAPAEDWDFWLRLSDSGMHAIGINEPLLRYRVWSGNASRNSVRMMQSNVRVLEKALARKKGHSTFANCARALQVARGNFNLALASKEIAAKSPQANELVWRAWKECPTRLKWLWWAIAASWPSILGGLALRRSVYRRICSKWP